MVNAFERASQGYYVPDTRKSSASSSSTSTYQSQQESKADVPSASEVSQGITSNKKKKKSNNPLVESSTPLEVRTPSSQEIALDKSLKSGTSGDIIKSARDLSKAGYDYNIKLRPDSFDRKRVMSREEKDTYKNTFVNERGQGFSQRPDTVVKSIDSKSFGLGDVSYFSGRKETVYIGSTNVYGKDFNSDSDMFKSPTKSNRVVKGFNFVVGTSKEVLGNINDFSNQNIINPLFKLKNDNPFFMTSDNSKGRILYSKDLGFTGQVIKGVGEYIVYKPANFALDVYGGRLFAKGLSIPFISKVSNTVVGRVAGTGLVGFTAFGVSRGYSQSENKGYFVGETLASFGGFGYGMASNSKGFGLGVTVNKKTGLSNGILYSKQSDVVPFNRGVTLFADAKRNIVNPLADFVNPFSIKTTSVKAFERGRTLPDGMVEVANVPGVGEIRIKAIPSQQAGFKELKTYQGTDAFIVSATTRNPYRNEWFKGFGVKKSYDVSYKGGASKDRLSVGGIELGQFFSVPELRTGKTQAYSHYLGEGASLKDVSSGSAKFSLIARNRFLVEKSYLSPYGKGVVKNIRGRSPSNPYDLKILQKYAVRENVPGTNRVGFAGTAGYRTEAEAIASIGSIKTRTPTTKRGKYGSLFGLGDYYIRLQSGKKVEIFNQKSEPFKVETNLVNDFKVEPIKSSSKPAKFDVSSSRSLRYTPYRDISISSFGSSKSSFFSVPTSSFSSKSSSLSVSSRSSFSSRSSLSSLSSLSSISSIRSSLSSKSSVSSRSSFSSRSSLSSSKSSRSSLSSLSVFPSYKPFKERKWSFGKLLDSKSDKKLKSNRKFYYVQSLEANIFDIRAKSSKINFNIAKTGLSLRPIVIK